MMDTIEFILTKVAWVFVLMLVFVSTLMVCLASLAKPPDEEE